MNEKQRRGVDARRKVLGDDAYDRNPPRQDEFSAGFSELLLESCWGTLWANDAIDARTRSLITLAILAATNRIPQLRTHLRGAHNNGCTPEEIREALLHVSVYAGVPAGAEAFRQTRDVLSDVLAEAEVLPRWPDDVAAPGDS